MNNIVQQEDMLMNSYRSFALYEGKSLSSVGLKNGYVNLNEDMLKQELIEIENSKKNLEDIKKKLSKIQQQKLLVEKKYIESIASVLTPEECIALAKLFESSKLSQSAAFLLYDEAPLALSVLLGIDANKLKEATDEQTEPSQEDSNEVSNVGYHTRCDPPRIFVLEFNGDTFASQVTSLREEVSCILQQSNPARGDKVILRLNSGGGTAAGYGLAASQLDRIKTVGKLPLICCIDEIAASGGYMMACVADKILASPFAIVGSVGVVATIPMFHERLKREGVEVMDVTAGKYKRTVTPYKAPTQSDRKKLEEDLAAIYSLFKSHISSQRPQLAPMIDEIATGEVWCGKHAVDKGLIDGIACFDDIIMEHIDTYEVLQLKYMGKKIEEEEEKAQGMFSDSSMGAASSNAWSGIGSGLLDRCINYIGSRVLKSVMGQLESELSANSDSYRPSGHTNAASSVKTSDFMLYRGQEGP